MHGSVRLLGMFSVIAAGCWLQGAMSTSLHQKRTLIINSCLLMVRSS